MDEELEPCPFCGSTEIEVQPPYRNLAICSGCFARGPIKMDGSATPATAKSAWNTRVDTTKDAEITRLKAELAAEQKRADTNAVRQMRRDEFFGRNPGL